MMIMLSEITCGMKWYYKDQQHELTS